jgi:hypothetical protein
MQSVYLDLNIFDRIEKIEKLQYAERAIFERIQGLIKENKITVPYSNAHLNDLFRGFKKNSEYIDGHLNNIAELTRNLCICQYWGRNEVTWHYRNVKEFFNEKKSDWEFMPDSFLDLLETGDIGIPNPIELYKLIPLPAEFKKGYSVDPTFALMYPKSRIANNQLSLMEDIFDFQSRLKSDYSLYKSFKSHLLQTMNKNRKNPELLKSIRSNFENLPKHLDLLDIADLYFPEVNGKETKSYSKVIETFYKFDLQGYKTDANYNNMFDDAMHTFYASQCDYFVTNDERCLYKAEKTYEKLKINTKVFKAAEFAELEDKLFSSEI